MMSLLDSATQQEALIARMEKKYEKQLGRIAA